MIEIKNTSPGRRGPVLLCDVCREMIQGSANVLYPEEDGPPRFVHKDCDDGNCDAWEELHTFFYQLVYNARVDLVEAEKTEKIWQECGL
jgi:hypothetical protein